MGHFRMNNGSFNDLMRVREGDIRALLRATGTRIGPQRHRCGRLQEHLGMAFLRGGICGRRSTGVGGVLVETGVEGLDALQEAEEGRSHARGGLLPILSWEAESIRKGGRIKPKQGAHDAVSSDLVSLSLPQKVWHGRRKMSGERAGSCIIPRDQIPGVYGSEPTIAASDCVIDSPVSRHLSGSLAERRRPCRGLRVAPILNALTVDVEDYDHVRADAADYHSP
jgi:hypothetical protein